MPSMETLKRILLWGVTLALAAWILWMADEMHEKSMRNANAKFKSVTEQIGKPAVVND